MSEMVLKTMGMVRRTFGKILFKATICFLASWGGGKVCKEKLCTGRSDPK
jgi:hypothetical protein